MYLLCFMKSCHCYILFHLSCSQYFALQQAGRFLIMPPLVCKKCPGGSLWCGTPGMDPQCELCSLSRGKGTARPPALSLTVTLQTPHCSRAGHRKIFLYHNVCGTYDAGSYRRSPVSLEADGSSFRAHPLSINFSFKEH